MNQIVRNHSIERQATCFLVRLGSNVLSTNTQFEDIEEAVTDLESTIKNLDAYSRSLESQVKKFEKQSATNRNKASKKD